MGKAPHTWTHASPTCRRAGELAVSLTAQGDGTWGPRPGGASGPFWWEVRPRAACRRGTPDVLKASHHRCEKQRPPQLRGGLAFVQKDTQARDVTAHHDALLGGGPCCLCLRVRLCLHQRAVRRSWGVTACHRSSSLLGLQGDPGLQSGASWGRAGRRLRGIVRLCEALRLAATWCLVRKRWVQENTVPRFIQGWGRRRRNRASLLRWMSGEGEFRHRKRPLSWD